MAEHGPIEKATHFAIKYNNVTYHRNEEANLDKREIASGSSNVVFVFVERIDVLKSYD